MYEKHPDRLRWNQRYADSDLATPTPCWLLQQHQDKLPATGVALDLACGLGGNALLLAQHGLDTHAWDISDVGLDKLQQLATQQHLPVHTEQRNLVVQPPAEKSFDVIVVSYYLERTLFPALARALKPGGLIYYQTFIQLPNPESGPKNPAYRLAPGELLQTFANFDVLAYYEDNNPDYTPTPMGDMAALLARRA